MDLSEKVMNALYDLGLAPITCGFYYLRDAILIRCENPYLKLHGEGGIFDKIAQTHLDAQEKNRINRLMVTRCVRHIANKCYASEEITKYMCLTNKSNVTVGRLVAGVAEYIKGGQYI